MKFEEVIMSTTLIAVFSVAVLVALILTALYRLVVVGRPDEWVLKIRNGKLVAAGIGIVSVRMPWERIVRFTAAMQRVAFTSSALSSESLPISVEGFVLWSVSPDHDGPFKAFSKLGIVESCPTAPTAIASTYFNGHSTRHSSCW
jgi:regulator of protease activity HflC (stomatin/prohibitin superfamily)